MKLELVSVHIPKTGGTSFFAAMRAHYGEALAIDNDHVPGTAGDVEGAPLTIPGCSRAVHGHFRARRYAAFEDAFYVTFLRDPAEQFISAYFFWLTYPPSGDARHDRLLAERPDIVTYANWRKRRMLDGFFDGFELERFNYIGFMDRRAHDCARLSKMLSFHIDANVRENPTILPPSLEAMRSEIESSPSVRAALRQALSADYACYERARSLWP